MANEKSIKIVGNVEDKQLASEIALLHDNQFTPLSLHFIAMINGLISRARKENDDADAEYIVRNQARISAWKQIIEYIQKGVPG